MNVLFAFKFNPAYCNGEGFVCLMSFFIAVAGISWLCDGIGWLRATVGRFKSKRHED